MPERVSFDLFTADSEKLRDRKRLIEGVLAIAPHWFAAPQEMMLLNWKTKEETHTPWDPESMLLTRTLTSGELLFVYVETPLGAAELRNNIMFSGEEQGAVFGFSVPRYGVTGRPVDEIEDMIVRFYQFAASSPRSVLAVGPEFDFTKKSFPEVLEEALSSDLVWWVVAAENPMAPPERFEIARRFDGAILLRRRDLPILLKGIAIRAPNPRQAI